MHSSKKSKNTISPSPKQKIYFRKTLLTWYENNTRSYPWVGIKEPYKVWLSEVILQQTRVEQGLPYYKKILARFPEINDLAAADDQEVFRLWQGLGYYNRCKNMLATARVICKEYRGIFPKTYDEILHLPGVGPYTAAAIASFAFNLPHAVVDGNVERLLSRYFGVEEAVNTAPGKKSFQALASKLLHRQNPAIYNQAIMDFGATVCLPRQPLCTDCPFRTHCQAFKQGIIEKLPVKKPKKPVKNRYLHYVVFQHENNLFIRKRPVGDIWQNLHEFFLIEDSRTMSENKLLTSIDLMAAIKDNNIIQQDFSSMYVHQLTHQKLHIRFLKVVLLKPPHLPETFFSVGISHMDLYAFPRPLVKYLAAL